MSFDESVRRIPAWCSVLQTFQSAPHPRSQNFPSECSTIAWTCPAVGKEHREPTFCLCIHTGNCPMIQWGKTLYQRSTGIKKVTLELDFLRSISCPSWSNNASSPRSLRFGFLMMLGWGASARLRRPSSSILWYAREVAVNRTRWTWLLMSSSPISIE